MKNPRAATRKWFSEARFGLFMHYGVYSIFGPRRVGDAARSHPRG